MQIHVMSAFIFGIILGLTITISIGPGFMALFQTSLVRGPGTGVILASGMLLSDITLISISYFGLAGLILEGDFKYMALIAGLILIIMGGFSLLRRSAISSENDKIQGFQSNRLMILIKGYLLNIANPFSFIFWIGIVGIAGKNWGLHSQNVLLFFAGVLSTAYSTDLVKCYISGLLRKVLVSGAILWMNRLMGVVLICIGVFIICRFQ